MLAYLIPGASPLTWHEDPRAARLLEAGPWQAQPHEAGCLIAWKQPNNMPLSLTECLAGRQTPEGMIYYGPKALPKPAGIARPNTGKPEAESVEVRPGVILKILPVTSCPRRLLTNGELGQSSHTYSILVHQLYDRIQKHEVRLDDPDLIHVALACMRYTYRLTNELIDDLGWLDTETIEQLWRAAIGAGKGDGT